MHKCLECLGLSLAEYARYSPLLFPPLFSIYTVAAIRRWRPGAGDPRWRPPQREDPRCLLLRRDPRWPGVVRRFPGRRPAPFRPLSLFCYIHGCCIQTWELSSRSSLEVATTTSRPPQTRTRSSSEVPRQEAYAFSIVVTFVLALLGHTCILVFVLKYCCFR